ncbi:MAG TPA: hypothetical protein VKB38_01925 [Terracidiphilus sp.]|nr:hypothetical protein [Terracidiphilus sp.]
MSDPKVLKNDDHDSDLDKARREISLVKIYGWMLVALLVAIGLATLIVLPFYRHR